MKKTNEEIISQAKDKIFDSLCKHWSVPFDERPEEWKLELPDYEDIIIQITREDALNTAQKLISDAILEHPNNKKTSLDLKMKEVIDTLEKLKKGD